MHTCDVVHSFIYTDECSISIAFLYLPVSLLALNTFLNQLVDQSFYVCACPCSLAFLCVYSLAFPPAVVAICVVHNNICIESRSWALTSLFYCKQLGSYHKWKDSLL